MMMMAAWPNAYTPFPNGHVTKMFRWIYGCCHILWWGNFDAIDRLGTFIDIGTVTDLNFFFGLILPIVGEI